MLSALVVAGCGGDEDRSSEGGAWRKDFNDWGTALTRGCRFPTTANRRWSEFVIGCRIYAPPTGSDEIRLDNLVNTIRVR